MSTVPLTIDEVWLLLQETDRLIKETSATQAATQKEVAASQKKIAATRKEIAAIQKETAAIRKETVAIQKEVAASRKENERQSKETDRRRKETDRQIKELGRQIGGLGEKFGSFTEGLALPSMEKILRRRFRMEVISPSVRVSKGDQHLEIDVLAYANGTINQAYVVEVKSHLRQEAITQIKSVLKRFRDFFPEHKDKTVFGILAAVDISVAMRERVLREGLYVARIHDNVFELDTPTDFQPKGW